MPPVLSPTSMCKELCSPDLSGDYKTPATSANGNEHEVGEDPAFPEDA